MIMDGSRLCGVSAAGLCALVLFAPEACVGGEAETANLIVSQLRSKKGIAVDLGCGDATLAIEVAKQSELIIYSVDPDVKAVEAARKAMDATGLYGKRLVARQGSIGGLPYPDMCLNLVFCGDEFVKGKRDRDLKEIYRVLSPNGVAFIGQSAAAAGKGEKLTKDTLEGWVKAAGITTYRIIEENGVWARITHPPLPGADEWTHRAHDPGNTLGCNDTAIKPPFIMQWANQATDILGNSTVLVAGGRQFLLGYYRDGHPDDTSPSIHAYDAYNGRLLWSKVGVKELSINRDLGHYTPIYLSSHEVATDRFLYVLGGEECYVFDADTGARVKSFPIPEGLDDEEDDIWLYVAYADGLLFGAAGPSPRLKKPTRFGQMFYRGTCRMVFALDPASGETVWKLPVTLMTNSLAVGGGRVYFLQNDLDASMILQALDSKTGKKLWSSEKAAIPSGSVPKTLTYYREKIWIQAWRTEWHNLYRDEGPLRAVPVYSAKDGKFLFDPEFPVLNDEGKRDDKEMLCFVMYAGDFALSMMGHHSAKKVKVDLDTGKAIWRKSLAIGGCGPSYLTPKYGFGKGNWVELDTGKGGGKAGSWGPLRTACHVVAIPASGMVYVPGGGCTGCVRGFRGNIAFAHGTVEGKDPGGERLVKGPAFGQPAGDDGEHAWVSRRNGPKRSGITAEQGPASVTKVWDAPMTDLATSLASSNGLVYVGTLDHKLLALDAATGEKKWQYIAESEIRIAPFLSEGRIYVSDDNGWAHCVRASDGALIWKFDGALGKETAPVDGRLNSRWQAGCGVVVSGGIAYFAVGYFPPYGTAVYALDAATGALKKKIDNMRDKGKRDIRFAARGTMAIGDGRLYIPNAWDPGYVIKMGSLDKWERLPGVPRGDRVMVLDEKRGMDEQVMVRSSHYRVVRSSTMMDETGVLPIVTKDRVYLRDGRLVRAEFRKTMESPGGLQMLPERNTNIAIRFAADKGKHSAHGVYRAFWKAEIFNDKTFAWEAWKGQVMTAAILAGDILITGGSGKVYATNTEYGKELWGKDVPGQVTDLAYVDGKLFAVCRKPDVVVCFGK
jgi:outer membrane protein assembly factor BamB